MKWSAAALLAIVGCAPVVPSQINLTVTGDVKISPSMDDLAAFFINQCEQQLGRTYADSDVVTCANDSMNKLMTFLQSLGK